MERDSRGRFSPGNQVAKGNRGNRKPKYGNSNALKHGLRRGYTGLLPSRKGGVSIYKNGVGILFGHNSCNKDKQKNTY